VPEVIYRFANGCEVAVSTEFVLEDVDAASRVSKASVAGRGAQPLPEKFEPRFAACETTFHRSTAVL
jgi:hypothetical protein